MDVHQSTSSELSYYSRPICNYTYALYKFTTETMLWRCCCSF